MNPKTGILMKPLSSFLQSSLFCALVVVPSAVEAQFTKPPRPAVYVLPNVSLVEADGSRSDGMTIVVRRGLIEALGRDLPVPAGAKVLEGDSLFVYPGLIDAEGGAKYRFPEPQVDSSQLTAWNPPRSAQSFTPHLRVADHLTATGGELAGRRQQGIVAEAVLPGGRLMPGRGTVIALRPEAELPGQLVVHEALGPTMSLRGASGVYPATLFGVIAFYRQMFEDAKHHQAQERAFRQAATGVAPPVWDADLAVVNDLLAGRTRAFFRADNDRDIRRVLALASEYGFHPVIVGGDEAWKVARELEEANVPVLVSLDFPEPKRWKPPKKKTGSTDTTQVADTVAVDTTAATEPEVLDAGAEREKIRLEAIYGNAGRLAAAGVRFALTSGGGKADLLEGARKTIEYGLDREAALAALTSTPAGLLGLDYAGDVAVGRPANLVVADGPLFAEGTTIRYTLVEGRLEEGRKARGAGDEEPAIDLTGGWTLTMSTEGGEFTLTLKLTQTGGVFQGTAEGGFGSGTVTGGSLSGTEVAFTLSIPDAEVEADFTGAVEGEDLAGTASSNQGSFSWTATRTTGPREN